MTKLLEQIKKPLKTNYEITIHFIYNAFYILL